MELYVFSGALLLLGLADGVSRCSCTLRYNGAGTLEAVCENTAHNRGLLRCGSILALRQDRWLTGADAVPYRGRFDGFWLDAVEFEAGGRITLTGSGLASLLGLRVIPEQWLVDGDSGAAIDGAVLDQCIQPKDPARALPFLRTEGGFSGGRPVLRAGGHESVYDGVRAVAELAGTGFAVDLLASRQLVFRQYRGVNRADGRFGSVPVLSESFGNLIESGYRDDRTDWHTTAYLDAGTSAGNGETSDQTENLLVINGELTGFDRREVFLSGVGVKVGENLTETERLALLRAYGQEALGRCGPEQRLEAAVREDSGLVFRRDYFLGDRFPVRSSRFGVGTELPVSAVTESWEDGRHQVLPVLGDEQPQRFRRLTRLLREQV